MEQISFSGEALLVRAYFASDFKQQGGTQEQLDDMLFLATLRTFDSDQGLDDMCRIKEWSSHLQSFPLDRASIVQIGVNLERFVNDKEYRQEQLEVYKKFKQPYDEIRNSERFIDFKRKLESPCPETIEKIKEIADAYFKR